MTEEEEKCIVKALEPYLDYQTIFDEIIPNIYLDSIKDLKQENERYKFVLGRIKKLVQGHRVADEVRLLSIMHYINEVLDD